MRLNLNKFLLNVFIFRDLVKIHSKGVTIEINVKA